MIGCLFLTSKSISNAIVTRNGEYDTNESCCVCSLFPKVVFFVL